MNQPASLGDSGNHRRVSREVAEIVALGLLVLMLRVVVLEADPFSNTDYGFISDWGNYWKNARLHALWGRWTIDDYNIGLYLAPAYTGALRLAFALGGVGRAQACLVNALFGTGTALAVYALGRAAGSPRTGLIAGLLIGVNLLAVTYDRSAYPEAFQLVFMVLAVLAIVRSGSSSGTAAAGGLLLALAILAKITGLVLVPIVGLVWVTRFVAGRSFPPRFSWRQSLVFAGTAGLVLAGFGLLFVWPHRVDFVRQFRDAYSATGAFSATGAGARWQDRVSLFGISSFGFRYNGFFRLTGFLVACTAVLAAGRVTRMLRHSVGQVELACWCWLGFGLLFQGSQYFQPDRRFLYLLPPLAVLSALLLGGRLVIAESAWRSAVMRRMGGAAAGALLAGVAAFYLVPLGVYKVIKLGGLLGRVWDYSAAGGVLLTAAVLAGAAIGALLLPRVRWNSPFAHQGVLVGVLVLLGLFQWGQEVRHRLYGMRAVATAIARLTDGWPPSEQVMVGWSAPTLTMGTHVLGASFELQGLRADERFDPTLEIYSGSPGRPVELAPVWQRSDRPTRVPCASFGLFPDGRGAAGIVTHLYVIPTRLQQCRDAVRATRSGTPSSDP